MTAEGDSPATKTDLQETRSALRSEIQQASSALRSELKSEIQQASSALRSELKSEIQAVRSELKQDVARVAIELVKTQADVREIKQTMATKEDVASILAAIDSFAKKGETYDRAAVFHGHALVEVQASVKDHERRLKTLESAQSRKR